MLKLIRCPAHVSQKTAPTSPVPAHPVLTGEPMSDFLIQRFDTEGAHGGASRAPHASATRELRKRPGHGRGAPLTLVKP
jgi:hypothetical protein